jgi:hypothetical protein
MGGLLDKANSAKEADTEETPEPVAVGSLEAEAAGATAPASGSPDTAMKLSLGGWVVILLGAILSLQGGAWGLIVVSIVLVAGIGAIVQADRMRGSVNKPKLYASIVVALLVAAGPYIVVLTFPTTATIAVTDVAIDEANDELDFAIRGNFNSVDVEISSEGDLLWTGSAEMTSDIKRFNVPINDFFDGNTETHDGTVIKTYTLTAKSSNGNTVELDINSRFLTRQAQNGGVQFTTYVSTDRGSSSGEGSSEIEGLRLQAYVGLFADGEKHMDDGTHSFALSNNMRGFVGQQTFTLTVRSPNGMEYTHPTVTLDGDVAKWTSDHSGAKSSAVFGFLPLSGTAVDGDGFEYVEKEEFFDGNGCYDFTLSVTNVGLGNEFSTSFSVVNSWEINWDSTDEDERKANPAC